MNAAARAAAYLRQTGAQAMTPTQARRYRRKIFAGKALAPTATASRVCVGAVDGPPRNSPPPVEVGGPASPAVEPEPLRPGT